MAFKPLSSTRLRSSGVTNPPMVKLQSDSSFREYSGEPKKSQAKIGKSGLGTTGFSLRVELGFF
jgi:hypothetical protein